MQHCKRKEQTYADGVSESGAIDVCGRSLKRSKMWWWRFSEREEQMW